MKIDLGKIAHVDPVDPIDSSVSLVRSGFKHHFISKVKNPVRLVLGQLVLNIYRGIDKGDDFGHN